MGTLFQNTRYHFLVVDISIHDQLRVDLLSALMVYPFTVDARILTVYLLVDQDIVVLADLRCSQIKNQ